LKLRRRAATQNALRLLSGGGRDKRIVGDRLEFRVTSELQ
jgi:hypothetical protein